MSIDSLCALCDLCGRSRTAQTVTTESTEDTEKSRALRGSIQKYQGDSGSRWAFFESDGIRVSSPGLRGPRYPGECGPANSRTPTAFRPPAPQRRRRWDLVGACTRGRPRGGQPRAEDGIPAGDPLTFQPRLARSLHGFLCGPPRPPRANLPFPSPPSPLRGKQIDLAPPPPALIRGGPGFLIAR